VESCRGGRGGVSKLGGTTRGDTEDRSFPSPSFRSDNRANITRANFQRQRIGPLTQGVDKRLFYEAEIIRDQKKQQRKEGYLENIKDQGEQNEKDTERGELS